MDYNKLSTFLTVAQYGSVSAAAAKLRRSQSAISQQIQLLEEELEFKLLERRNAHVFLSKDGEDLLQSVTKNLRAIDDAILEIKDTQKNAEGLIKLGEITDFGNSFQLGEHLGHFVAQHPKVTFEIIKGTSAELEQALIDNKIDMAFTVYFTQRALFHRVFVEKTWHSLYASKSYLKKIGGIKNYKQLIEADLIDLNETFMCIGTLMTKNSPGLAPALQHRRPNLVVSNHLASRLIVISGFGVAVLPDYLVEKDVKAGRLVRVLPKGKKVYAGLDLAYRTNRTLRLCDQLFVDYFRKISA